MIEAFGGCFPVPSGCVHSRQICGRPQNREAVTGCEGKWSAYLCFRPYYSDQEDILNMCGIVGYVGKQQAAPLLLDGLCRLEYRGYDSAGVAVCGDGRLTGAQDAGAVCKALERADPRRRRSDGHRGHRPHPLGHPRRAQRASTPTPRSAADGKFAVVHNGIIENYARAQAAADPARAAPSCPKRTPRWWRSCWTY